MYTVDITAATSATLTNLQCNTIRIHHLGSEWNGYKCFQNGLSTSKRYVLVMQPVYCAIPPKPLPLPPMLLLSSQAPQVLGVTWQWSSSGSASRCFNTTSVTYRPGGGGESSLQLSDPAATEATLTDLQCNTNYTITVVATAGEQRREGATLLPLQGYNEQLEGRFTVILSLCRSTAPLSICAVSYLSTSDMWQLPATHSSTSTTKGHIELMLMRAGWILIIRITYLMSYKKK